MKFFYNEYAANAKLPNPVQEKNNSTGNGNFPTKIWVQTLKFSSFCTKFTFVSQMSREKNKEPSIGNTFINASIHS